MAAVAEAAAADDLAFADCLTSSFCPGFRLRLDLLRFRKAKNTSPKMAATNTRPADSPTDSETPELSVSSRAATEGAGSTETTLAIVVIAAKQNLTDLCGKKTCQKLCTGTHQAVKMLNAV